jgi:hypothetical protein
MQNDLFRAELNAIRPPDPFHLIRAFQRFRDSFLLMKLCNDPVHPLLAGVVDFRQVMIQLASEKHTGIECGAMLF